MKINSAHYTLLPFILLRLTKEIGFDDVESPNVKLINLLEEKIHFNFNLFSANEMAIIGYSLNYIFKKGSLSIRKNILEYFLKLNFENFKPE